MRIHHAQLSVKTAGRISVENVTPLVRVELERAATTAGIAVVSVPHTTCGIVINEDERGLRQDMLHLAERLLAPLASGRDFAHNCVDDNAQAHLTSILLGHSVTVPVAGGQLVLGTWQSIFLIEMDGPRTRALAVQILGE
ncbi:MAG TPA: secondary thiamine-phosphate synthase enzyme YjbQ [Patescibacteria group bacterium]|nr:secondary thiamine-phosphate synthase enzyme YjbQ [Patescibacteria group bacterium]